MFSFSQNRTICEINGELMSEDTLRRQYFDSQVASYPQAFITPETLRRSAVLHESAQSAFIERSETLAQKVKAAWYAHGATGALGEISDCETDEARPQVKKVCRWLLVALRWLSGMQFTLFPHLKLTNEELIGAFAENNDWLGSPVRYLAWHPRSDKFALALKDDTVRIYYSNNDLVPMLKHKLQRNVTMVAWKPLSASTLAVAAQTAILIWNVDPSSLLARPSASAVQTLSYGGHSPVTSIAWSPQGQDRLFAACALNSAFVVWDVSAKEHQVIQHMGAAGGITRIGFSPDGFKLMASTPGASFRVFESSSWTNERWSRLAGRVQSFCWNPDGTFLFFCLLGDPLIYSVTFPDSRSFDTPVVDGSKHASVVVDLSLPRDQDADENIESRSGANVIHSIAMDGTGERMAVLFARDDPRSGAIAIFSVSSDPIITVCESGFVQEEGDNFATFIAFKPNFDRGALLTVCYSGGLVRHIPFYFKPCGHEPVSTHQRPSPGPDVSTLDASQSLWTSAS